MGHAIKANHRKVLGRRGLCGLLLLLLLLPPPQMVPRLNRITMCLRITTIASDAVNVHRALVSVSTLVDLIHTRRENLKMVGWCPLWRGMYIRKQFFNAPGAAAPADLPLERSFSRRETVRTWRVIYCTCSDASKARPRLMSLVEVPRCSVFQWHVLFCCYAHPHLCVLWFRARLLRFHAVRGGVRLQRRTQVKCRQRPDEEEDAIRV